MTKNKEVNVNRAPREIDERAFNETHIEEMPDMSFLDKGTLWYDPSWVPEGMQWGWVVTKIFWQEQDTGFSNAQRKGWSPIPAGKYPVLNYLLKHSLLQKIKAGIEVSDIIEVGGQVLCERPLVWKKAEDAKYAKVSQQADAAVNEFITQKGLKADGVSVKYSNKPLDFGA